MAPLWRGLFFSVPLSFASCPVTATALLRRARARVPYLLARNRNAGWLAPMVRPSPARGRVPVRVVGAGGGSGSVRDSLRARILSGLRRDRARARPLALPDDDRPVVGAFSLNKTHTKRTRAKKNSGPEPLYVFDLLAPRVGIEPTTCELTDGHSPSRHRPSPHPTVSKSAT